LQLRAIKIAAAQKRKGGREAALFLPTAVEDFTLN